MSDTPTPDPAKRRLKASQQAWELAHYYPDILIDALWKSGQIKSVAGWDIDSSEGCKAFRLNPTEFCPDCGGHALAVCFMKDEIGRRCNNPIHARAGVSRD